MIQTPVCNGLCLLDLCSAQPGNRHTTALEIFHQILLDPHSILTTDLCSVAFSRTVHLYKQKLTPLFPTKPILNFCIVCTYLYIFICLWWACAHMAFVFRSKVNMQELVLSYHAGICVRAHTHMCVHLCGHVHVHAWHFCFGHNAGVDSLLLSCRTLS